MAIRNTPFTKEELKQQLENNAKQIQVCLDIIKERELKLTLSNNKFERAIHRDSIKGYKKMLREHRINVARIQFELI